MSECPAGLALVGATATGKTALSVRVAQQLDGEIISMDSRQVYRGMDIGTAKVSPEEKEDIPHHGLDLCSPQERFSAGRFAREARNWIAEIQGRGRLPVLVGGTGFFLKALTDPLFQEPSLDPIRRSQVDAFLAERTVEELRTFVQELDPDRLALAESGGRQRLIRSAIIPLLTGRPLTWWHEHSPPAAPAVPLCVVLLDLPMDVLDQRIGERVFRMLEGGFVEEVEELLAAGFSLEDPGMSGTGYRQVVNHLQGELTLPEAAEAIRVATRQYAKRQRTWFRNQLPSDHLVVDGRLSLEEQVERVVTFWTTASTDLG